MLFYRVDSRLAAVIRVVGLALVTWSVVSGDPVPATTGRGLLILCLLVACVLAFLVWTAWHALDHGVSLDLYVLVAAGGVLIDASPHSASSAFVFVAVVVAGMRVEIARALPLLLLATLAVAASTLAYHAAALGLLAYALGFVAALLAASNSRQSIARADQAELLLAQAQRSQEERVRAARLEESTRIAREIHDVLAHALAGLTIQLEATRSLVEQGADRELVLERVQRAHALAREGLRETRHAVGALRGDPVSAAASIEALVAEYRTTAADDGSVQLAIDGDPGRLTGPTGLAVVRTVQEALTNVRKHATGAEVSVVVHAGADEVVAIVSDHVNGDAPGGSAQDESLALSGGGYGLQGMRERAQSLGGTLSAGAVSDGWRVELRLPGAGPELPA